MKVPLPATPIFRQSVTFMLCVAGFCHLSAQVATGASTCRLMGADTITAGSIASFTLTSCTATNWSTNCGTVTAQAASSVTINFSSGSCGTAIITATGTSPQLTKSVTIVSAPTFSSGAVSQSGQNILFNKIPALIQVAGATGGLCNGSYTYQWFSSADNSNFSPITGATAQNYQPGPLTATTYFKRQSSCALSGSISSNTITVTVNPLLVNIPLSPATQAINSNTVPAALSVTMPTASASFRYAWQNSTTPGFTGATIIPGANASVLSSDTLGATTYFRALIINNKDTLYSSPAVVSVYPPLNAGTLLPATQTISSDSLSELLTCTGVTGGSGAYSYMWYSSSDGTNWTAITGVPTSGYNPGGLTATTWYRVVVVSNGQTAISAPAVINITPQ